MIDRSYEALCGGVDGVGAVARTGLAPAGAVKTTVFSDGSATE